MIKLASYLLMGCLLALGCDRFDEGYSPRVVGGESEQNESLNLSLTDVIITGTGDYGAVDIGQQKSLKFKFSNATKNILTNFRLSISGEGFSRIGIICPSNLAPAAACVVEVIFKPVANQIYVGSIVATWKSRTTKISQFALKGTGAFPPGKVKVASAPNGEVLSKSYQVQVNGQNLDIYTARTADDPFSAWKPFHGGNYSFANFDMEGTVVVTMTSVYDLSKVVIQPLSASVSKSYSNKVLTITLNRPQKLSIETNGKVDPLLLFANPMEQNIPNPNDPNVIYYGPGIHNINTLWVSGGKTIYIADGAVVKGAFLIRGDNVTLRGRGILCQNDWPWYGSPGFPINFDGGFKNFTLEGITIRGSATWTIGLFQGDIINISNVKICGGRVQNDDGIDICNSSNVNITDVFIRTDDDSIALKGVNDNYRNVENITVKNSILWSDRARITLFAWESKANYMRNIIFDNIDVIHYSMTPFLFEPNGPLIIRDVTLSNWRIRSIPEGDRLRTPNENIFDIVRLVPIGNPADPGWNVNIMNINFSNIAVKGTDDGNIDHYKIITKGLSESHRIENVSYKNFSIFNEVLTPTSKRVSTGFYTGNITFSP